MEQKGKMETAEQTVQRLKEQHRERSKRHYAKKRERKQEIIDDDASSVSSTPTIKRRHTDGIPYEDVREAVYRALDEKKEKEKEKSKSGIGGMVMAAVGLGGLVKTAFDHLPALQAFAPKFQSFLASGLTSDVLVTPCCSSESAIFLQPVSSCIELNDDLQTNDIRLTGPDTTTVP